MALESLAVALDPVLVTETLSSEASDKLPPHRPPELPLASRSLEKSTVVPPFHDAPLRGSPLGVGRAGLSCTGGASLRPDEVQARPRPAPAAAASVARPRPAHPGPTSSTPSQGRPLQPCPSPTPGARSNPRDLKTALPSTVYLRPSLLCLRASSPLGAGRRYRRSPRRRRKGRRAGADEGRDTGPPRDVRGSPHQEPGTGETPLAPTNHGSSLTQVFLGRSLPNACADPTVFRRGCSGNRDSWDPVSLKRSDASPTIRMGLPGLDGKLSYRV